MSKYDNTKFYWYMLTEDFFRKDNIVWLREHSKGDSYALFYLALCSKAIKTNGLLIRDIGDFKEPYTNKFLAKELKFKIKIVNEAIELFKKMGLVRILDEDEIFLTNLENMVGERSKGAFQKQIQQRLSGKKAENLPPDIEKYKDTDLERDLYLDSNENDSYKVVDPEAAALLKELENYDWLNDPDRIM